MDIVLHYHLFGRELVLVEVVHLLGQVKGDSDTEYQNNGEEECSEELPYDISVNSCEQHTLFVTIAVAVGVRARLSTA